MKRSSLRRRKDTGVETQSRWNQRNGVASVSIVSSRNGCRRIVEPGEKNRINHEFASNTYNRCNNAGTTLPTKQIKTYIKRISIKYVKCSPHTASSCFRTFSITAVHYIIMSWGVRILLESFGLRVLMIPCRAPPSAAIISR